MRVEGLGLMSLGSRVAGLDFRVAGLGLMSWVVQGFRVRGLGLRV